VPNSGTVTAGSLAQASQYNNLRDDVLNVSTGHTHSGTAEGGAPIEGTVIRSTGVTSGYLLTAGAGGTSTTWTAPTPGASFSFSTVSAVWGAQNSLANMQYVAASLTTVQIAGVTGGGTVLALAANASATSRAVRTFNANLTSTSAGSVAAIAAATISPVVAGTVGVEAFIPLQTGFSTASAGTSVYFLEEVAATTTGARTLSLRKYTRDLATNTFNATIYSALTTASGNNQSKEQTQYAPEVDCFVGYYIWNNTTSFGSVYAVNATSGSVYQAAIGTGTFSAGVNTVVPITATFVPGTAGTDGTVHVFGTGFQASNPVNWHATYALTSSSLTFVAIDSTNWVYGFTNTDNQTYNNVARPRHVYWDSSATAIILQTNQISNTNAGLVYGYDRTMGTLLFTSTSQVDNNWTTQSIGDTASGWRTTGALGGGVVYRVGVPGDFYMARQAINTYTGVTGVAGFMGAGSATHALIYNLAGSAFTAPIQKQYQLSDYVTIAGTSTKSRLISFSPNMLDFAEFTTVRAANTYSYNLGQGYMYGFTANSNPAPLGPLLVGSDGTVGMQFKAMDSSMNVGTVNFLVRSINIG
jgi:hypothetical protein